MDSAIGGSGSLFDSSRKIGSGLHRGSPSCGCILFICLCVFTEINPGCEDTGRGGAVFRDVSRTLGSPVSGRKWFLDLFLPALTELIHHVIGLPLGLLLPPLPFALTQINLLADVPHSFFQILNRRIFVVSAPQILDGIADAEVHVLGDLYALNALAALAP